MLSATLSNDKKRHFSDSDSVGQRFESARAYHEKTCREAGFFAVRRGFEVYPRKGKSARAYHEKTCREAGFFAVRRGFEVYPREGKSARAYHEKTL